jgi:hypothetical protein
MKTGNPQRNDTPSIVSIKPAIELCCYTDFNRFAIKYYLFFIFYRKRHIVNNDEGETCPRKQKSFLALQLLIFQQRE